MDMDKIKYMLRMRDWFIDVRKQEGVVHIQWRGWGHSGSYITTSDIINTLNKMIWKYSIGCTMEDIDKDTLNLYREFYNINRGKEFIFLITTI